MGASTTSWIPARADRARTPLDSIFGLRPNLYAAFRDMSAVFWEQRLVDPVILELCRLRIAELHGCRSQLLLRFAPARDAGLGEDKIAALERFEEDARFTAEERACLRLAEHFARDVHGVTDADGAAAVGALGEEGAVGLLLALALFDGFSRFRVMLGIEAESDAVRVVEAPARGDSSME